VRTILADYIAGLIPNPQGTCSTLGTAVTWISGPQFSIYFNGASISIDGVAYTIFSVNSPTSLTLTSAAGTQTAKPWVATIPTGEIFNDSQAYVVPTINLGWRKLQKKLTDKGHPRLQEETVLVNCPAVTDQDPAVEQWINWSFFFDGTNDQTAPVLPGDFIAPLRMWERPSASGVNLNLFRPMRPAPDALRARRKGSWNVYWDWRNDAIYIPGSILDMDLRLRYSSYLPDIAPANGGFASTAIPILRCAEALAYYAAAEFVNPRGGVLGTTFEAKGDVAVDAMTNAFAKLQQRASFSRRAWGGRGRRGCGLGRW
jgi:hypothetical protein